MYELPNPCFYLSFHKIQASQYDSIHRNLQQEQKKQNKNFEAIKQTKAMKQIRITHWVHTSLE